MDVMFKIGGVAITAVLCGTVVRRGAPEFALLLTLVAGCWILLSVLDGLGAILAMLEALRELSGLDTYVVEPVVKTVALSILTRLTGEICRGAGEGGIAAFVEIGGTILALVVALPLVYSVLSLMSEMLL